MVRKVWEKWEWNRKKEERQEGPLEERGSERREGKTRQNKWAEWDFGTGEYGKESRDREREKEVELGLLDKSENCSWVGVVAPRGLQYQKGEE